VSSTQFTANFICCCNFERFALSGRLNLNVHSEKKIKYIFKIKNQIWNFLTLLKVHELS